jgi:hypothetical protein
MDKKKYSSYAEIDRDLEILKIEKEIHYQKLLQSLDSTTESLNPSNLVGSVPKMAFNLLTSNPVRNFGLSFLLKKLFRL